MLVELFYHIDEFCKIFEKNLSKKLISGNNHVRNRECRLSLSEIMTICAYFHYSKYKTFKDYYCKYVLVHMQSDFKGLVSYNRFIELKPRTVLPFAILAKFFSSSKCTGTSFIDSFLLAVCDNRRIHSHKVFKGIAQRGKTSMGWFFGFKLHFAINHNLKPIEEAPTFVLFAMANGIMLGLWSRHTANPQVTAQPGSSEICLIEDKVDELYEEWKKQGVTFSQDPHKMEGGYSFVALDIDGHRIRVLRLAQE